MSLASPYPNGQSAAPPRQGQPILMLQLLLLDNGQVLISTPPDQLLNDPVRIALAAQTCGKARQHLDSMPYPAAEGGIEVAPPGAQVERNPKA